MSGLTYPQATPNNRFERSRVASSVSQGGGVDDLDKVPSFDAGATPRRSTSSLGTTSNFAAVSKTRDDWQKWLRWEPGRQGTGYDKCLILASRFPIPFDCYLLRFPEGTEIPPHRDPVTTGRHYRLNVVVKRAPSGGDFVCADPMLDWGRLKFFRSDQSIHSVTRVVGGTRYVLSIGWVLESRA